MMFEWRRGNFWIAGQLSAVILLLLHLVCLAGGNGHGHHNGHRNSPIVPRYSPNMNPFLPLYSNAAPYIPPAFNTPSYGTGAAGSNGGSSGVLAGPGVYATPLQQQQPQQLPQAYHQPQPPPYPNTAPAYVPIQQAYTVAYYPTFQPTPPPVPTGPYIPAPPGQRPHCAKEGQTFCEQVDYYPTKIVLRLLEIFSSIENFLVDEDKNNVRPLGFFNITPTYFYDYSYTTNSNGQVYSPGYYPHRRNKRQAEEDDMCPVDEKVVTARAAENVKGDWKFVVNIPEVDNKYTQVVQVASCRSSQCRGLCTPPSGATTRCDQQYVQTRLFALDPSGDKFNNELFKFPHGCVCKISSTN